MKAVIVGYNEALSEEVMEVLEKNGIQGYTQWANVLGKGIASGPHLMTNVWPVANNVLLCVVEEDVASRLLEEVRGLRAEFSSEGVKAFQFSIEAVT